MEEKVGYAGEAPSLPSWAEEDWRLQEMLSMGPQAIMEELLGLSEEIHDSRLLHEETKFELRQTQERLKLMETQALQAALDSEDKDVSDQVKGKNAEERKRKADIYLADHPTVKQLAFEIKPLESLEAAARLAMEERLDRSKNLHQWARMFEAQVRLLSTVRMPEPVERFHRALYFVGEGKPPLMVGVRSEMEAMAVFQRTDLQGYTEVAEAAYVHAMEVYRRSQEPVLEESDVLAAMGGIEVSATSYIGEESESDVRVIFDFAKQAENEVRHSAAHSVWVAARGWMSWYYNPIGSPPVDTAELIERIIGVRMPEPGVVSEEDVLAAMTAGGVKVPVETSYVGEEPEPDGARFASEVDELFPPDVQIPPSMDVSEAEVDDVKAAIKRYQAAGEKVDESSGPSL